MCDTQPIARSVYVKVLQVKVSYILKSIYDTMVPEVGFTWDLDGSMENLIYYIINIIIIIKKLDLIIINYY